MNAKNLSDAEIIKATAMKQYYELRGIETDFDSMTRCQILTELRGIREALYLIEGLAQGAILSQNGT